MKIQAIRKRYDSDNNGICAWKKGDTEEIKESSFESCCPDAAKAWEERFIGFGEFEETLNKNENVCIYRCSPWPEGASWDEIPINNCPFCGEKIQINIDG